MASSRTIFTVQLLIACAVTEGAGWKPDETAGANDGWEPDASGDNKAFIGDFAAENVSKHADGGDDAPRDGGCRKSVLLLAFHQSFTDAITAVVLTVTSRATVQKEKKILSASSVAKKVCSSPHERHIAMQLY